MAIAFDANTNPAFSTSTSKTYSHTCTGSNLLLLVGVCLDGTKTCNTVTYNGVSMTKLASVGTTLESSLWYLIAPATGANNVVITPSGSCDIGSNAISYTGVKQSGFPDASITDTGTTTTSYSKSVTTIADNCWATMFGTANNTSALTAGSNTTIRSQPNASVANFLLDTNGPKTPAGVDTLAVTSANQTFVTIMASFAPFISGSAYGAFLLAML